MADSKLSLTAGTTCATCNNPDPCLCRITLKGFDDKEHIWPEEKKIHLKVLDDGTGSTGTIKIDGKCCEPTCPKGWLESTEMKIPLQKGLEESKTLHFKKNADDTSDLKVNPIWDYLSNIALPTDIVAQPRTYSLMTQGCYECSSYAQIDVYPAVEFQAAFGFIYEQKGEERTWKDRTEERIAARRNMQNTKPKNKNKLRSGWTLHTDQFKVEKEYKLSADFELSVAGTKYSAEISVATKKVNTFKTFEHISKVKKFISNIGNHLLVDKNSRTPVRKVLPVELNFDPIEMEVAYAYQRTEKVDEATHFFGFVAAPLLKTDLKINILPLVALLSRSPKVIKTCNDLVASGALDLYLMLSLDLSVSFGATFDNKLWEFFDPDGEKTTAAFDDKDGTKLAASIQGVASTAYEKEAVWANVSLKFQIGASGKIKTTFGVALDAHDDGIDLVGYHDGIVIELGFNMEFKAEDERGEFEDIGPSFGIEDTITLGKPLEIADSAARVNLFGKPKKVG